MLLHVLRRLLTHAWGHAFVASFWIFSGVTYINTCPSQANLIVCLQFLENTHTVEILREAGPGGLHVKDLATRITDVRRGTDPSTKDIDSAKISTQYCYFHQRYEQLSFSTYVTPHAGHVLRLLATTHWLREVRPDVFANNRLSSFIDSGKSTEQIKSSCVPMSILVYSALTLWGICGTIAHPQ